jgi:hypothetical protein
MTVFVECKPDETLVVTLGVARRSVTHYSGRDELFKALTQSQGVVGVVDEDPLSVQPTYLRNLGPSEMQDGLRCLADKSRNHRVVILCPRLDDWLVATTKGAGLDLRDFGFAAHDAYSLHGEINERLSSLKKLLESLLNARNKRLTKLRSLLTD